MVELASCQVNEASVDCEDSVHELPVDSGRFCEDRPELSYCLAC
jgi:hypothetical protein